MKCLVMATACSLILTFSMGATGKESTEGQKENPYVWKSKVASVAVFKNGVGFFLREGKTKLRDGWCLAQTIPPASFGTLVVFPQEANRTIDIVGAGGGDAVAFDGVDSPNDEALKRSRLENCINLRVQLSYSENGKQSSATGRVVSVGNEHVILEAETNSLAVPLERVTKLLVLDNPMRIHVASNDKKPAEETTLSMTYLRKGITWIPEYSLKLLDDSTAELTLRGTLVNEAEDLINCDVQFVAGVPHFAHTDYLEAVSAGQVVRTTDAALASSQMTQAQQQLALTRQLAQQSAVRAAGLDNANRSSDAASRSAADSGEHNLQNVLGNLPRIESEGASDYTVYECKGVTVRLGEKAVITLLTKTIQYRHGYRWHVPNDIEHCFLLQNDTDSAWTTGPCLVLSDNRALSEDLLKYVPRGGMGELTVTTAVNMGREQNESETGRKQQAYQLIGGYFADLVSLGGELRLRNFEKKSADIIVELTVRGKPTSASDEGDIVLNTQDLRLLERTATITWQVTVPAGQMKTLTYQYERYVPAQGETTNSSPASTPSTPRRLFRSSGLRIDK